MRGKTRAWVSAIFIENAKKKYPGRSLFEITMELNKSLEESLYGTSLYGQKTRKKR